MNLPEQVDPYRRKPLIWLVVLTIYALVLIGVESVLMPAILFAGRSTDLWQAGLFGALLLFVLYRLAAGIRRWWCRPRGQEALERATVQIAELSLKSPLVSRAPNDAPPNVAILSALPILAFLGSSYCFFTGKPVPGIAFLFFAASMGFAFWRFYADARNAKEVILTIDPKRKVVIFENFTFVTHFLPEKPRPRKEIPFGEILDCTSISGSEGGPSSLKIVTTKGPTFVSGKMEDFDSVRCILESIFTLNLANPERRKANLARVPKIRIPLYGWLICLGAVAALAAFIWMLTTQL